MHSAAWLQCHAAEVMYLVRQVLQGHAFVCCCSWEPAGFSAVALANSPRHAFTRLSTLLACSHRNREFACALHL